MSHRLGGSVRRIIAPVLLAAGLGLFSIAPTLADYQAGVDAYQKHDFTTAFTEFSAAAQAGDPQAQNALGAMYNHGLGVDLDNSQAAYWYQKAADQNFPLAMRNLATMYTNGHGVPYDLTQAKIWFAKAAELGDNESARRLAALQPLGTAGPDATPAASFPVASAPANPVPAPVPSPGPIAAPQNTAATAPATPAPAPVPAPAAVQPVAMTPAPAESGNWLLGQWQGPSLGCPPGGGIEFGPNQALTYFNGQVAVTLSASYRVSGDTISVTTTGADGVGQNYVYQRSTNDAMTIVGIPDTMPKSLLGAAHQRCGAAPAAAAPAAQQATTPPVQPMTPNPTPEPQPLVSPLANLPPEGTTPEATTPAAPATEAPAAPEVAAAAPAAAPAATTAVPANATTKDGWDAFERGDYQGALGIWKSLAQSDKNVSVLVGTIYDFGQGVPQDDAEALKWYLQAAEAGNGNGQYRAASIYARSQQVPPDYVQAYKWLTLAMQSLPQKVSAKHDELTSIQAELLRSEVSGLMSTSDIGQADALAKTFKPTP